jgi:hypothetical protein
VTRNSSIIEFGERRITVMTTRLLASFGGVVLAGALACGTTSTIWAAEPTTTAPDPGVPDMPGVSDVHSVHCQTPQFDTDVKFSTPGTITPGGGPVCYTGIGTAPIELLGVAQFWSGAHSGSVDYRYQPGLPIIVRPFTPGQSEQFNPSVEVLSLTITS